MKLISAASAKDPAALLCRRLWMIGALLVVAISSTVAFCPPGRGRFTKGPRYGDGSGGNGLPPSSNSFESADYAGDDGPLVHPLLTHFSSTEEEEEGGKSDGYDSSNFSNNETSVDLRGGSSTTKQREPLASTASFWSRSFSSVTSSVTAPFRAVKRKFSTTFRSKRQKQEDELMEKLTTTAIRQVVVPNTTVLPSSVVQIAARRAGMVGKPLRMDRVNDFARALGRWYNRNGYILHSVTGATLVPESATAEITVQEPITSKSPVGLVFCKEMVIDEETGDLLTFRQYKERHMVRRTLGFKKDISKRDLNTTYVTTGKGRTRPKCIATALGLTPGQHFRWDGSRFQKVASSGIFARVLQAAPRSLPDGSVQLQMLVNEAPPRHLEYGLARSLYTGSWEGEVDFEHNNILGGGEILGFSFRRGRRGPSGRLRFSDTRFGMEGGYDMEVFSDFIGDEPIPKRKKKSENKDEALAESKVPDKPPVGYEKDFLNTRRGATFRLRNPIDRKLMLNSVGTASVERVSTKAGFHESIGSVSLGVGPFNRELPLGARSNVDARFMLGTRVRPDGNEQQDTISHRYIPYSSVSATTRQTFPLLTTSTSSARPIILALKHSVTTSTKSLPRHEAKAQGVSCNIRGASSNDGVSSALTGTTELRIPIQLPFQMRQDASVVLFGDWLLAKPDSASPFVRKTSVGLGLRKSLQGIPIMYNLSYNRKESKVKASFGLGRDFEV